TERGAPATAAADASGHFARGSAAFAAGDYAMAAAEFEAAVGGSSGPAVLYNLGVSYYRLGDYEEAEQTFRTLAREFPAMRALADYNIGLALVRQDRIAEARSAFERATAADDEQIATLAHAMLARLPDARESSTRETWTRLFDFRVGHDDNVALVDPLGLPSGRSSDSAFNELLLYAGGPVTDSGALSLDASLFVLRYPDADEFDQSGLYVRLRHETPIGAWSLSAGPQIARTRLGGTSFDGSIGVGVEAERALAGSNAVFGLVLTHDEIDAESPSFAYVDGNRRRVAARVSVPSSRGRFVAEIGIEEDDRAGAGVNAERNDYSLRYRHAFGSTWNADFRYQYRRSDFDRLSVARDESRRQWSFEASRRLGAAWQLAASYRRTDNSSNDPQFSFDRRQYAVGISRLF
ncbi:MAG: tetratricopeptide repeat protein, partial [Gammaproteobacteria bacterium]|nr:tetratricopeptide repeat protein [Gammaproteobacteria bacterium]